MDLLNDLLQAYVNGAAARQAVCDCVDCVERRMLRTWSTSMVRTHPKLEHFDDLVRRLRYGGPKK